MASIKKRMFLAALAAAVAVSPAYAADPPGPAWPPEDPQALVAPWTNSPDVYGENLIEENIPLVEGQNLSLDGEWGFSLYADPAEALGAFSAPASGSITVPGPWQTQGYDYPIYSTERYPWAGGENMEYPMAPVQNNPTAVYSREFTVPYYMQGKPLYLHIECGGSAVYAYVNGEYAGYGEGGFLQKSFDITGFVRSGSNELSLVVLRYSDGSYLENRNGFNLSGLYGSVSLRAASGKGASFTTGYENGLGIIDLEALDGTAEIELGGRIVGLNPGRNELSGVSPWSDKSPQLYNMSVTKDGETVTYKVGFRSFDARDGRLWLNGEEFTVRGIKYSAFTPDGGYYADHDTIKNDVALMKSIGVNTVVTDGMPLPEAFYDIADGAGLLVVDCGVSVTGRFDASRYDEAVLSYASRMIKRDKNHCSVVMWGLGADTPDIISKIGAMDSRPVLSQSGNGQVLAYDNGEKPYIITSAQGLPAPGENYAAASFADEALYAVNKNCEFRAKNQVGGSVTGSGLIKNHMGRQVIGNARLDVSGFISGNSPFTVELWANFDGETRLEVADGVVISSDGGRITFSVEGENGGASVSGNQGRGAEGALHHVGAVYTGSEIRLFVDDSFKDNREISGLSLSQRSIVGGGAVREISIYNRALGIDELSVDGPVADPALRLAFDELEIIKDNSEVYLGYGGDFGDYPNSGAGVARGVFTALREPLPESRALAEVYLGPEKANPATAVLSYSELGSGLTAHREGDRITVTGRGFTAIFDNGVLISYVYGGAELLSAPVEKSFTLPGRSDGDGYWQYAEASAPDSVELSSTEAYADITANYDYYDLGAYVQRFRVYADGTVAVLGELYGSGFGACADIFTLNGDYSAEYLGYEASTYSDFIFGEKAVRTEAIKEKLSPYLLPREYGNHTDTDYAILRGEGGKGLVFAGNCMEFNALPYSFAALDEADHGFKLAPDGAAHVRVGGYVAPVYKTGEGQVVSSYRFRGLDSSVQQFIASAAPGQLITSVLLGGGELQGLSPVKSVYSAYYDGGDVSAICVSGATAKVEQGDGFYTVTAELGSAKQEITVYLLERPSYISDLKPVSSTDGVTFNKTSGGGSITVMGDFWRGESNRVFEKGIAAPGESETVFDVSAFDGHVISFTVAQDFSSMSNGPGGGGWAAFGREASFYIYGDGQLLASAERVSLRDGSRELVADISGVSKLSLVTKGEGNPIWAGGSIAPKEPRIYTGQGDGNITVTVVNSTQSEVRPIIYARLRHGEEHSLSALSHPVSVGAVRVFTISTSPEDVVDFPFYDGGDLYIYEKSLGERILFSW